MVDAVVLGRLVGKTALAVYWAHRTRARFPDGQLYANLRGHAPGAPAAPVEILAQFLAALGIPPDRVPPDAETAAALYRTLTADRRILVIHTLDVDDREAMIAQIRERYERPLKEIFGC